MSISLPGKPTCKDQDRLQLRELLLAGSESAPAVEANADYFEALRKRAEYLQSQRAGKRLRHLAFLPFGLTLSKA